jgi:hypothetical protein
VCGNTHLDQSRHIVITVLFGKNQRSFAILCQKHALACMKIQLKAKNKNDPKCRDVTQNDYIEAIVTTWQKT